MTANVSDFRARRLAALRENLDDLLMSLMYDTRMCENCGAYHSKELHAIETLNKLKRFRSFLEYLKP